MNKKRFVLAELRARVFKRKEEEEEGMTDEGKRDRGNCKIKQK